MVERCQNRNGSASTRSRPAASERMISLRERAQGCGVLKSGRCEWNWHEDESDARDVTFQGCGSVIR